MLKARGAVSLVTLVFLVVLATGVYAAWLLIPPYFDNLEMREAVTATFNRMRTDPDDDRNKTYLLSRTDAIGTHWETRGGLPVEQRGLGLGKEDFVIERETFPENTGRVQVDYQRIIRLWPTDSTQTLDFHVEKAGTLVR